MRISEIIWPDDRVEHIGGHKVDPVEVEEACFGRCLVLRAKSHGKNPVYYVLGQTQAGRYLMLYNDSILRGKGISNNSP